MFLLNLIFILRIVYGILISWYRSCHVIFISMEDAGIMLMCIASMLHWLPNAFAPSPVYVCLYVWQDYRLNFGLWEKHAEGSWHGGSATIESHPGAEVWGVVWTLDNENLASLDE